jgi:hypothetical protein
MAIQFKTKTEGTLLLIETWGDDESLEEVQQYGLAIIQACLETRVTRVLCDERQLEYRLATVDTFKSAEFLATNAPRLVKMAVVCAEKYFADLKFWETVANNRGLEVRAFQDLEAARHWVETN